MKSHRGPPQSSSGTNENTLRLWFSSFKKTPLSSCYSPTGSPAVPLCNSARKKSSRRSSPARLVALFPHLEGTNTNSVRLFQLRARPHSLSRFGVLPREKVCFGLALTVPEKGKKKEEKWKPLIFESCGPNFLAHTCAGMQTEALNCVACDTSLWS